ncbi:ThiF family adenylyltransferase [Aequorivita viscosa]|nr:ThiF family adenylyltransferase [Aequorivita viscosa]
MMHIKITEKMHQELKNHLHCGDGLEALAFAICGRLCNEGQDFLFVHKLILMPYIKCERSETFVAWKTIDVEPMLEEALEKGFGVVKFHSHFVEGSNFSILDDNSDTTFFDSVYGWMNNDLPHSSVIMFPDGSMKGRVIGSDLSFHAVDKISIIGHSITGFPSNDKESEVADAFVRNSQAFGNKTVNTLRNMKIGVVGCSGTGSPLVEMLFRLGVGTLVLIDSEPLEIENLNRIPSSKLTDVKSKNFKVDVLKDYIDKTELGTRVIPYSCLLQESRQALNDIASCDFVFGCMDSVEGRHYLNLISTYYLMPIIDIGVKLVADGEGGIDSITGNIHYVIPNLKTLEERGVYSYGGLAAESLKRISTEEHKNRQAYFENAEVDSPAVISINTACSSMAVNEMLSRIHPYRNSNNDKYSFTVINITEWEISSYEVEETKDKLHSNNIGVGMLEPNLVLYDSQADL